MGMRPKVMVPDGTETVPGCMGSASNEGSAALASDEDHAPLNALRLIEVLSFAP